ncbi:ankyrin repeat-containing domain protein [Xylaria curta]|nr:ankyrin repeat-containing domain protein [Xylaria curta]
MNSAGVIRADGHARVHIGDSYSTIHNCAGSPAETDTAKVRTEFLQRLYTSPYEDRKNRNPKRASGTCEWFTAHPLFQNWLRETSALLWVSADPGCGKSVLAKYLIDNFLPPSASRTTCYFFFKDDFDDQRVLEGALCCILHQIFTQNPGLLTDEILENFKEGDRLFASFSKLWGMLIGATEMHKNGEIICVLDALDECVDQTRLANALTEHYSKGKGTSTLKFLVTSRPYLRIQREFQDLKESQPTIHLSGESQEEVDKIAHEITIVIQQRIEELGKRLQISNEERERLKDELAAVVNRTYLWVYLVFAVIEEAVFLTKGDLRTSIRNLPKTAEEAYDNILRKSHDPENARKILQIIVAADRPLLLTEMAAVLAFRKESHRCHEDLDRDILSPDRLYTAIRETCGLFVVVQDDQVYLLHQTAREFLVQSSPKSSGIRSPSLEWKHTLNLKQSHRLLSEICIRYLLLADFERPVRKRRKSHNTSRFLFLNYAACNWADHYRQARNRLSTDMKPLAMQLCDTSSPFCSCWLKVYGEKQMQDPAFPRKLSTSLLIASFFGLESLVNPILQENESSLDRTSAYDKRTALSWASERGYHSIVQLLLDRVPKPMVFLRDRCLLLYPTIVNQTDEFDRSPLWYAAANGHQIIVQKLLKKGAKVDIRDLNNLTPLSWAIHYGYSGIVALLLEKGARDAKSNDLEARDRLGDIPLIKAAEQGNEAAVKLLLGRDVNVNGPNRRGRTALMRASLRGHDSVIELLLDHNANVDASDRSGWTALMWAAKRRHESIVKLLLDHDANINISDKMGRTALIYAAKKGQESIVKILLDHDANVNVKDLYGWTALMYASKHGHKSVVKLLRDNGG